MNGKRILIWSEHGFGDQIMYARFAKILAEQGAEVAWLCAPELHRLFASSLGVTILSAGESRELQCDYYIPSSSLPLGFNLTVETIPAKPYLFAKREGSSGRIGIMPTASVPVRSLPEPLGTELAADLGAIDLRPEATGALDFQDTAQIIANLDLVITVDTAVAHLAGAMGKPVWVLLPTPCDWRWMDNRSDSPWYPSARLFRGDWAEMADQVRARSAKTSPDAPIA